MKPLALVACLVLVGCSPRIVPTVTTVVDTVAIERRSVDTVIVVQKDSALLRALIECDSLGRAQLVTVQSRSGRKATISHAAKHTASGGLVIECSAVVDSLQIRIHALEERIAAGGLRQSVERTAPRIEKHCISPWAVAFPWLLCLLLVIALVWSWVRR